MPCLPFTDIPTTRTRADSDWKEATTLNGETTGARTMSEQAIKAGALPNGELVRWLRKPARQLRRKDLDHREGEAKGRLGLGLLDEVFAVRGDLRGMAAVTVVALWDVYRGSERVEERMGD